MTKEQSQGFAGRVSGKPRVQEVDVKPLVDAVERHLLSTGRILKLSDDEKAALSAAVQPHAEAIAEKAAARSLQPHYMRDNPVTSI